MLTTIIYRSHICDNVSFKSIEAMVAGKRKKWAGGRHRYFTFNGRIFQLIEGPEEKVQDIYQHICRILATIIWWSCFAIMRRPVVLVRSDGTV